MLVEPKKSRGRGFILPLLRRITLLGTSVNKELLVRLLNRAPSWRPSPHAPPVARFVRRDVSR
jgi:hypothetical protein